MPFTPAWYDPLSTDDLVAIICQKFDQQSSQGIAKVPKFPGSGLYAIYYSGRKEPLYRPLSGLRVPVYVGQSRSHNSATGGAQRSDTPLWERVKHHADSILGTSLDVADFDVRLLLMPDVHIDLGENGLRVGYKPVWNSVLRGFGNHEQGSSTRTGAQTAWDAAHPGRSRTYGKLRDASKVAAERARASRLIAAQVALCGARGGIDWSSYDPDAITT